MRLSHDTVRGWAEAILAQLGPPAGHSLSVTGRGFPDDTPAGALTGSEGGGAEAREHTSSLRITPDVAPTTAGDDTDGWLVTLGFADGSSVAVHLEEPLPEAEAVTLLADQLQDAVLEETGGFPNPPCPGHSHPATASIVHGIACWTCPSKGEAWPILRAR